MKTHHLTLETLAISDLIPSAHNPRTHSKKQIRKIAESMRIFGVTNPILVDNSNRIIAGHGRVLAAQMLGLPDLPVRRLSEMSAAELRAYAIADNRIAQDAGWDASLLKIEFAYLETLNIDLSVTGFESLEIDQITCLDEADLDDDDIDPNPADIIISRPGDLWILGEHRLLCGDALNTASYESVMESCKSQMIFADPPYNVPINGHVCGLGAVKHDEFAMASGEMSETQFTDFLTTIFKNLVSYSENGAISFVCMDWRHSLELLKAGRETFSELKNLCVWRKQNAGMGSFYRNQHELIYVFKAGTKPHINNFSLGEGGRYRTNIWAYSSVSSFHAGRDTELQMHPTTKPVALVADAILDCSRRGGLILDPFCGSGTTLIAAEKTGRRARAIELDRRYVDVAVRRWEKLTGKNATHAATGDTFEGLSRQRSPSREESSNEAESGINGDTA